MIRGANFVVMVYRYITILGDKTKMEDAVVLKSSTIDASPVATTQKFAQVSTLYFNDVAMEELKKSKATKLFVVGNS